jgi:hypothetical protein
MIRYRDFAQSISPTRIEGFLWNFIDLSTTMRSCVTRINEVSRSKVNVIEKRLFGAQLLHAYRNFNITWHKCSPLYGGVSRAKLRSLLPRPMSHIGFQVQIRKLKFVLDHLVISYWRIETQMVITMTTGVNNGISFNIGQCHSHFRW